MEKVVKRSLSLILSLAILFTTALADANVTLAADVKASSIKVYDADGDLVGNKVYADPGETIVFDVALSGPNGQETTEEILYATSGSIGLFNNPIIESRVEGNIKYVKYTQTIDPALLGPGECTIQFLSSEGTVQQKVILSALKPASKMKITVNDEEIPSAISVVADHQIDLDYELDPKNSTDTIEWSVLDTTKAEISEDGVLTAKSAGATQIVVKTVSKEGKVRTLEKKITLLVVKNNPAIKLDFVDDNGYVYTDRTEKLGHSFQMKYKAVSQVEEEGGVTDVFIWESSDEKVATVSDTGVVTTHQKGTTTITMKAENPAVVATCQLTVYAPATSIRLSESSVNVKQDKSITITATETPNAANEEIIWTSDNPKVAVVKAVPVDGEYTNVQQAVIKGVGIGTTIIRAKTLGGVESTLTVTVSPRVAATTVKMYCDGALIGADGYADVYNTKTIKISASLYGADGKTADDTVAWTILDNEDDIVDATINGDTVSVKGNKAGSQVRIKAYSAQSPEVYCICTVNVLRKADSVVISTGTSFSMHKGEKHKIIAQLQPVETDEDIVEWISSNENIAKVDENGVVTAINSGKATITLETTTGFSKSINLTVFAASEVTLPYPNTTKTAGSKFTLTPNIYNADQEKVNNVVNLVWTSSDPSIARVSSAGEVEVLKPGDATITVTCGSTSVSCDVLVTLSMTSSLLSYEGVVDTEYITNGELINFDDVIKVKLGSYNLVCTPLIESTASDYDYTINGKYYSVEEGSDCGYIYSYTSDVAKVGSYKVTFVGDGKYYLGYKAVSFKIVAKALTSKDVVISDVADQYYTGSAIKPGIVVKDNDVVLKEGTDYSVVYTDNTNAGTATVKITGKGNYSGVVEKTFKVIACPVSKLTYTVAEATYTGGLLTPKVTVKNGTRTLKEGTDYTIKYGNNRKAGTACYRITAVNPNYSGTVLKYFKIAKRDISKAGCTVTIGTTSADYTGKAIKQKSVTVKYGSLVLKKDTDYYIAAYYSNVNAGKAKVVIKGKGTNFTGRVVKEYTIRPKNISNLTVGSITNKTYTGSYIKPAVVVKNGSTKLKSGTHYTLTYANNKNVGTATVTIKGKGNFTGTKTVKFNIVPKKATISSVKSTAKKTAQVKWGKVTGAGGYKIQFCRTSSFKSGVITVTASSALNSITTNKLVSGRKYYVRVCAYKGSNQGAWSSLKTVTIK